MKYKFSLFFIVLLSCVTANAETYLGFSYGSVDYDTPTFDKPNGYSLFGGYKYTENFSLELAYADFGDSKDGIAPVWTLSGTTIGLGGRYLIPVNEAFNFAVGLGIHSWDVSLDEAGYGELGSDSGTDLYYGIGAAYSFTEKFSLGLDHNVYTTEDADLSMTALRFQFDL